MGWSGGEQLFWNGAAPGASLELVFNVPASARYVVELHLTRAPDYGQLRFEVDSQGGSTTFDGFDPGVVPSGPVQLGTFTLAAGTRNIRVTIIGRHARSSGYFAGIDSLRLVPVATAE